MDTAQRVAVITGASSGIGRAVALALAAEGFRVAITARREAELRETVDLAGADAARLLAVPGDVTSAGSVQGLFEAAVAAFGRVDMLFNNAGVSISTRPLETISPEDWRRVIDINLTGSFLCAQAAFRIMKAQNPKGGRIINNGSISAHAPRMCGIAYTASKHAITGLTKSLSLEGREHGISCCQIDIGNAAIPRTDRMEQGMLQADGSRRPEPRMDVALVAKTVLYMATLPNEISVPSLVIMPNTMPFLGRG